MFAFAWVYAYMSLLIMMILTLPQPNTKSACAMNYTNVMDIVSRLKYSLISSQIKTMMLKKCIPKSSRELLATTMQYSFIQDLNKN